MIFPGVKLPEKVVESPLVQTVFGCEGIRRFLGCQLEWRGDDRSSAVRCPERNGAGQVTVRPRCERDGVQIARPEVRACHCDCGFTAFRHFIGQLFPSDLQLPRTAGQTDNRIGRWNSAVRAKIKLLHRNIADGDVICRCAAHGELEDQFPRVGHGGGNRNLLLNRRFASRCDGLVIEGVKAFFRLLVVEADLIVLGLCRQQVRTDEVGLARREHRACVDQQLDLPDLRAGLRNFCDVKGGRVAGGFQRGGAVRICPEADRAACCIGKVLWHRVDIREGHFLHLYAADSEGVFRPLEIAQFQLQDQLARAHSPRDRPCGDGLCFTFADGQPPRPPDVFAVWNTL